MPEHRPASPVLMIAVTLTVLLGLYAGVYFTMVSPEPGRSTFVPVYVLPASLADHISMQTGMRIHLWCRPLFRPIHFLDRLARPDVWEMAE